MYKRLIFFSSILAILSSSCGDDKNPSFKKKRKTEKQHTFFNLQRIFSPIEKEISFPIWFDETMVKKNGIKQITRNIYALNETDSTSVYPKEKWMYHFNGKGKVTKVNIAHFYENTKTDEIDINYPKESDDFGFSEAKINEKNDRIVNTLQQYSKNNYGAKFLIYENKASGDYLFYVIDPKMSKMTAIDQTLSPTIQDIVGIGTPTQIEERFILENMMEQHDKIEFSYDKKHLEKIQFDNLPFHTDRYIHYDDEGHCSGFSDSTFSHSKYLSCIDTKIAQKNEGLPTRIIHTSKSNGMKNKNIRLETFEYLKNDSKLH